MPGCTQHRPPPLVFTGSLPPGAMAPSAMKSLLSPLAQKPRSSRKSRVFMVKASYSSTTSMSFCDTPAMSKARLPDSAAAVTVRSSMDEICRFQTAVALPST
ncbi:hypothetical protein G6F63_016697 [Rhizopus arrhizus]|nr:hypothetical protein G6F63_016697 [Rhizopus arrhizus]